MLAPSRRNPAWTSDLRHQTGEDGYDVGVSSDRVRPADVDIGALLGVALGPPPPSEFAEKVGSKVTLMTTVTELSLLLFAAPFAWLRDDVAEPSNHDSA